ncbi:MAG: peroxiredoxin [Pseudomonadota bacterium]
MPLTLGDLAPDFKAETTQGEIQFHKWIGDNWCILFSHPKDFTPVCTTELGAMARLMPEFARRDVKVIGLSVDPLQAHTRWKDDIEESQGVSVDYPLIADEHLKIARLYGMLPADISGTAETRTAADNQTARSVFVISPDKKIKLTITYPMSTGRNFSELLRVIDSLQLTDQHKVATPADWRDGEDVIILPSVADEDAKKMFADGWHAPKPYMRIVPQPQRAVR